MQNQCVKRKMKRGEKKKNASQGRDIVLGFLRPVSRTGSPQDESHIHIYSVANGKVSHQNTNKKLLVLGFEIFSMFSFKSNR